MKDQHEKIKGYRDLSQAEIDAMNECKEMAERVKELVEKVSNIDGVDLAWVQSGKHELQKGFMSVVRGIARPETF